MITYNDIYEALRKERYSEQLQLLPKKFIQDVSDYIKEKKKVSKQSSMEEGDKALFSDEEAKIKKQLENATAIFNELMLLRKKKLLGLVFLASETGISKRDFENMMEFEKELFDKLIVSVQESEKILAIEINNSHEINDADKELKLILFLEDIDELIGLNGEALGPFKKDEIVNLPKQVADILISDQKAEIVLEE
ncbi:hypothetical protein J4466_02045 [Candidatus Pacearchaeota archaeon]|nr:hypothetical protein [Candidatus Pacearchaeota archaeon]